MKPVARTHSTLAQVLALQHFLAEQRHADRVAKVVIGCIAVGDKLERHVPHIIDDTGVVGLEIGIGADVALVELIDECIRHHGGRIEHGPLVRLALALRCPHLSRKTTGTHGLDRSCPVPGGFRGQGRFLPPDQSLLATNRPAVRQPWASSGSTR